MPLNEQLTARLAREFMQQRRMLVDTMDLSIIFGINVRTVETWIRKKILPPPIRPGGTPYSKRYWHVDAIEKVFEEMTKQAAGAGPTPQEPQADAAPPPEQVQPMDAPPPAPQTLRGAE
jgi:hypothetical protein